LTLGTRKLPALDMPMDDTQVERVRRRLLYWGRRNFKSYAWRYESDPWLSFVAEFLLQRTRASQVEPAFLELRARFPSARALADGGQAASEGVTEKLGLHWRGPLLAKIAQSVAELGGVPPEDESRLRGLTGVGMYTAAAWLSLHRGIRATIIDANVVRWLSRMTGLPYNRDPRHLQWVQRLADGLTPQRAFRDYNYAVLDFTMAVCTPRCPQCGKCPLLELCLLGTSGVKTASIESNRGQGDGGEGVIRNP
jgi:A/G-specific adenine glycosylase